MSNQPLSIPRSSRRRVGLAVLSVVLVLVALEGASQIAWRFFRKTEPRPEYVDWFVYSRSVGWLPKPNFSGRPYLERRDFDESGRIAGDVHADARRRILLIGDSCTYGYGVSTPETYAVVLESLLDSVDVVNLGVPGYTSYQGARLLEGAFDLQPDLVVAAFGFNDRRYVLDERYVDGPRNFRRIYWRSKLRLLDYYYTYRSLRWIIRRLLPRREPVVDLRTAPVRVSRADYLDNLGRIVDLCEEHRVPAVLLLLGENPDVSTWIRRGRQAMEGGGYAQAIEAFQNSMRLNLYEALARRYLAEAYTRSGDPDEAERVAVVPAAESLHGGSVLRAERDYSRAMVNLGRLRGVPVVDVRQALGADTGVYFDAVHFNGQGHRIVAEALAGFIREEGPLRHGGD